MEPKSYQKALEELQEILRELQDEKVPIDALSDKAERAKVLIDYCSGTLRKTEERLEGLFGTGAEEG